MIDKVKLAMLLRSLAEIVEVSSQDELNALVRSGIPDFTAALRTSKGNRNRKTSSGAKEMDSKTVSEIVDSMRLLSSREAGVSLLESRELNKRSLEQIARQLDLPVLREDTHGRLVQKIVEAALGPRLNSEAIRGDMSTRYSNGPSRS